MRMLTHPYLAAAAVVALVAAGCTALPPWSATHAVAVHYMYAYALAIMLCWLPLLRLLRPVLSITEPLLFAVLAAGLMTLAQPHHAAMLLLGHALLFSLGAFCMLGRHARFGTALQFVSSLGMYVYAASFLLRAIILN